ncbi:uncharacterized protein LOC120280192 isoform X1 [Dioscorea cayenensis subsp. rotundata]|uniref:Uncharacterized protein LOC120280192 isoform X1 n=1 Tax=Dioscorea cayennensis subsp. rotundata TaxID=55577 RepID=A0AB40CS25_DIOCR|nr:uncharacterized protein LOC120280192 isoform X1 [Dioscorea cayenensis subsp. rotundata]XP_039142891.1 uncharacterized protein LOC120280192 isoform X1 [Dioscorea cayenensis subsp. rotundata]
MALLIVSLLLSVVALHPKLRRSFMFKMKRIKIGLLSSMQNLGTYMIWVVDHPLIGMKGVQKYKLMTHMTLQSGFEMKLMEWWSHKRWKRHMKKNKLFIMRTSF